MLYICGLQTYLYLNIGVLISKELSSTFIAGGLFFCYTIIGFDLPVDKSKPIIERYAVSKIALHNYVSFVFP